MKKLLLIIVPLIMFITSISSCKKPTIRDTLSNVAWKGNIHNKEENNPKVLSPIVFKMIGDTAYVYSNAIFGADNDTLKISEFSDKDSIIILESKAKKWQMQPYLIKEKPNDLVIVGKDFYLYLEKMNTSEKPDLSFYMNEQVSPFAYMYLDGTYEGEIEMENQMQNMFLSQISPMGIKMKIKFLDESNLKLYTSAFMGNEVKTHKYYVRNESLFIDNGNKFVEYEVKNNGNTIVLQDDKVNLVLRKKY